jgi:hypothetical protein
MSATSSLTISCPEVLAEQSWLGTAGIDAETGTEIGEDIVYAPAVAIPVTPTAGSMLSSELLERMRTLSTIR